MKRKLSLFFALILFALCGSAQQSSKTSPVNPDSQVFMGYLIKVIPAEDANFGYEIWQGKDRLLRQVRNPFTGLPVGLLRQEDLFKVAQWQIAQLRPGSIAQTVLQRPIP